MSVNDEPKFATVYRNGVKKGYDVDDTFMEWDEKEEKYKMSMDAITPYHLADGTEIRVEGTVTLDNNTGKDSLRTAYNILVEAEDFELPGLEEYWMNHPDVDWVILDENENPVDKTDLIRESADFLAAASEYPSVLSYEEWKDACIRRNEELQKKSDGKLNLPEPTEEEYGQYLNGMDRQRINREIIIGTYKNDPYEAMETTPSYEDDSDDFFDEMDRDWWELAEEEETELDSADDIFEDEK